MTEWNKCPGCFETTCGRSDYCPHCGEQLNLQCAHCGLTWRFWENRRFCPKCGAKTKMVEPSAPVSQKSPSGVVSVEERF
jgi:hypothetical protein